MFELFLIWFLFIELSQVYNKYIFKRLLFQASIAALDFVACQSVAEGGEYP